MNCNQIREFIPALVRRELSGFERIPILEHLQHCPECRSEYRQFVKIFYSIDLEAATPLPFAVPAGVLTAAQRTGRVRTGVSTIFRNRARYIAAAILIPLLALSAYFLLVSSPGRPAAIVSAGGQPLDIAPMLSSSYFTDTPNRPLQEGDRIALSMIENQLLLLQKRGISNFKLPHSLFAGSGQFASIYNKTLPVDNCLQKVQSLKKYKSSLKVTELVSYLNVLKKQGA